MSRLIRGLLAVLLSATTLQSAHAESPITFETSSRYTMGPQDKLKVRVYDWRVGTYDTHAWPALTGEFAVGASGAVSFPIVGEVLAEGKTPAELAALISDRLRVKVGLAQTPYASVEIVEYRPFYILGAVAKPGEYPYRPGLTVLQALGVGGGIERTTDASLLGLEREALSGRGEIRVLEAERRQVLMRQARITAELQAAKNVRWPQEIIDQTSDPSVLRAMQEEEDLLVSHHNSLQAQYNSVVQSKKLLSQERSSLDAKRDILQEQTKLSENELRLVSALVARGLAGTPRQVALQQNQAQLESNRVDLELAAVRTQQDGLRLDRDYSDFEAKYRSQLLADEAELRARLASISERIASLHRLIDHAETRAPMLMTNDQTKVTTRYSLGRMVKGDIVYTDVSESFLVRPGDTLRVELHRSAPRELISSSAP